MTHPKPDELSRYADGASPRPEAKLVARHLSSCDACTALLEQERDLADAFGKLTCPDPETLAQFIDETLPGDRLEAIAGHVLGCDPCQDVVTWTREAEQQLEQAPTRRRRRPIPQRQTTPTWIPAVAAVAAACLLVVLLLRPGQRDAGTTAQTSPTAQPTLSRPASPSPSPRQSPDASPSVTASPDATPSASPNVTPRETPSPRETASPDATPSATVAPEATPRETPTASPSPTADPSGTQTDPTPTYAAGIQVALLDGALDWSRGDEDGTLERGGELPVGAEVRPARGQATLGVAGAAIVLDGRLALAANDRVEVLAGEAFVDAAGPGLEVACADARVRALDSGARFAIAAQAGGQVMLSVIDGAADASGRRVESGQAARLSGGAWDVVDLPPARAKALRERALTADLQVALDAPYGLLARASLDLADLEAAAPAERARAAWAVLALAAAEPRLARLAEPRVPAARAALDALLTRSDAELVTAQAAAPVARALLAGGARFGRRKLDLDKPTKARLEALAEALCADPAALAADVEALAAVRAVAEAVRFRLPKLTVDGDADQAVRAILAGARLSRAPRQAAVERTQAELAQDPLTQPRAAAALRALERRLVVLGLDGPEPRQALLAHAALASPSVDLALVLSQDAVRLAGRQPQARPHASVLAVRQGAQWRVIFRLRGTHAPSRMFLATDWNGWSGTDLELERRDGAFVTSVLLEPGRHEYKLVHDNGDVWETDPDNPLVGPSNVNETNNSVLILPE